MRQGDPAGARLDRACPVRHIGPMTKPVYILNGPNLNLLGQREPEIYGRATLADIEALAKARAKTLGLTVEFRQSNAEGELIGWVQEARHQGFFIIINAAGLTHTSVALLDALQASELPVVEVHLSTFSAATAFGSIPTFRSPPRASFADLERRATNSRSKPCGHSRQKSAA